MAFTDFLSRDVGGYNNAVNDPGGLGVSRGTGATGITWGQLLQAAQMEQGGNSPPNIATGLGQQIGQSNVYQLPVMNLAQQQRSGSGSAMGSGSDMGDIQEIMSVLGSVYGVGG